MIIALGDVYAQIPRRDEVRELMRVTRRRVAEQPGRLSLPFAQKQIANWLVRTSELRVHVVQESFVPLDSSPIDTSQED